MNTTNPHIQFRIENQVEVARIGLRCVICRKDFPQIDEPSYDSTRTVSQTRCNVKIVKKHHLCSNLNGYYDFKSLEKFRTFNSKRTSMLQSENKLINRFLIFFFTYSLEVMYLSASSTESCALKKYVFYTTSVIANVIERT